METTKPAFMTSREAAAFANVSEKTLARAAKRGDLQAYRPCGLRKLMFRESDLVAWITGRQSESDAVAK